MRQHPHLAHPSQVQPQHPPQSQSHTQHQQQQQRRALAGSQYASQQQRSFSSSEEEFQQQLLAAQAQAAGRCPGLSFSGPAAKRFSVELLPKCHTHTHTGSPRKGQRRGFFGREKRGLRSECQGAK